jgi:hypothetical protein
VEWTLEQVSDYPAFVASFQQQRFDIALAPLRDSPFNRAKSGLKFLEYAAIGAAGIFSDVPAYAGVVEPGVSGLLARTADDWQAALGRLIEDAELRLRLALAAQAAVRQRWLLSAQASRWAEVYETAARLPAGERLPAAAVAVLDRLERWGAEAQVEAPRQAREAADGAAHQPALRLARWLAAASQRLAPAGSLRARALDRLVRWAAGGPRTVE